MRRKYRHHRNYLENDIKILKAILEGATTYNQIFKKTKLSYTTIRVHLNEMEVVSK